MPSRQQLVDLDFLNVSRVTNLPAAVANGQPVVFEQLATAVESTSWKPSSRVASTANINLAAPGASIDSIAMVLDDPFTAKDQTVQTENGIYLWKGAAVSAVRAAYANTFKELEAAVVATEEGTVNAGTQWRQTQVNGVLGTNNIVFIPNGSTAPSSSEVTAGLIRTATQAETNAGTIDTAAVTPLKLANSVFAAKNFEQTIGDGTLTSITVTHNLGTRSVKVCLSETAGSFRDADAEVRKTTINSVTLLFNTAPANASLLCNISRG
jgi:hypothetical protein